VLIIIGRTDGVALGLCFRRSSEGEFGIEY